MNVQIMNKTHFEKKLTFTCNVYYIYLKMTSVIISGMRVHVTLLLSVLENLGPSE